MTRETKVNLIFLGVLLPLLLPGAAILAWKKYHDHSVPMAAPKAVRMTTAYCDPLPRPDGVVRVVPELTEQWVRDEGARYLAKNAGEMGEKTEDAESLSREVTAGEAAKNWGAWGGEWGGARGEKWGGTWGGISEARMFEVVGGGSGDGGWVGVLLVWDGVGAGVWEEGEVEGGVVVTVDGQAAQVLEVDVVALPVGIRHDLQSVGFVLPPDRVAWVVVGGENALSRKQQSEEAGGEAVDEAGKNIERSAGGSVGGNMGGNVGGNAGGNVGGGVVVQLGDRRDRWVAGER